MKKILFYYKKIKRKKKNILFYIQTSNKN